jgi:hypothetical protein
MENVTPQSPGIDKILIERGRVGPRGFDRLDRNKDGKITLDEAPNAARFKALDKNGDGVVIRDELTSAAKPATPAAPAAPNARK